MRTEKSAKKSLRTRMVGCKSGTQPPHPPRTNIGIIIIMKVFMLQPRFWFELGVMITFYRKFVNMKILFFNYIQYKDIGTTSKVPAIVDNLFFLSLRTLWRLCRTSLRTINALAPPSNNHLIVHTLEFLFSSIVPGLIGESIEF